MKQVLLVDGRNLAYRSHFTHSALSSHGQSTSVIFGATNMLLSLQRKLNYIPMIIVWDGEGKTWRHELTKGRKKEYKGNRAHLSKIRTIVNSQIPIFKELWTTMGIWNFEVPKLEADDLIGILATYIADKETQVIIYSGDRDFQQLLSDKIVIWAAQGRSVVKGTIITPKYVEKRWGVKPEDYRKMRAFCGDKSDNISNIIKGIGAKTAVKLLKSGLDPSLKFFHMHSKEPFNLHSDRFASLWYQVHENYHLCKIITEVDSPRLSNEINRLIRDIMRELDEKGLNRQNWNLHNYRKTLETLVKFELDEIYDRMQEIRLLP
jgi:DNA polymerase-1